jgi:hypothetical protein
MKMHNWIFRNGSSLDIAYELARLTNYLPERLIEVAAFIVSFRPHDVRFALGPNVWTNGSLETVDCVEPAPRLEVWMSTEFGDHVMTVDA